MPQLKEFKSPKRSVGVALRGDSGEASNLVIDPRFQSGGKHPNRVSVADKTICVNTA